jgi:peptidoglycan hydrolase CwlO-like protein
MKNYLLLIFLSFLITSCNSKKDEKIDSLLVEKNKLLSQINSIQKKSDSLQEQLEKCDNWVNFLESD